VLDALDHAPAAAGASSAAPTFARAGFVRGELEMEMEMLIESWRLEEVIMYSVFSSQNSTGY
jgi:hypothetical protein